MPAFHIKEALHASFLSNCKLCSQKFICVLFNPYKFSVKQLKSKVANQARFHTVKEWNTHLIYLIFRGLEYFVESKGLPDYAQYMKYTLENRLSCYSVVLGINLKKREPANLSQFFKRWHKVN